MNDFEGGHLLRQRSERKARRGRTFISNQAICRTGDTAKSSSVSRWWLLSKDAGSDICEGVFGCKTRVQTQRRPWHLNVVDSVVEPKNIRVEDEESRAGFKTALWFPTLPTLSPLPHDGRQARRRVARYDS